MTIECVFFDAGNTLIYPDPLVGEAYARVLRKRGIEADAGQVAEQFKNAWMELRRQQAGTAPPYGSTDAQARQWWRRVVRLTFRPYEVQEPDVLFEELWEHFADPASWRVYPDVFPTLQALRKRSVRVGLISNWDSRLVPLLGRLGIWELLDAAAVSFEVGVEKPHPLIFRQALSRCGVRPQQAALVGDSLEEDVQGATAAGLRAVWLRRGGPRPAVPDNVVVIASLEEALALRAPG